MLTGLCFLSLTVFFGWMWIDLCTSLFREVMRALPGFTAKVATPVFPVAGLVALGILLAVGLFFATRAAASSKNVREGMRLARAFVRAKFIDRVCPPVTFK